MNKFFFRNYSKKDYLILFFTTVFLTIGFITFFINDKSNLISLIGLLITSFFVIKFFRSIPLFIMFLFFILYNVDSVKFFYTNIDLTLWPDFQQKDIINKVLLCNSLFIFCLGNYIPSSINNNHISIIKYSINNRFFFFLNLLICILIILFSISGESIINGGVYGEAQKSPLNEYFILFYLFLFLTKPKVFFYKNIILFVGFIYCFQNLIYGGRIEILQLCLLTFYTLYVFEKKINYSFFYLFILFAFYFNMVIDAIRSNPIDFISGYYLQYLDPRNLFFSDNNLTYLASNQGDVIQSSGRILGLIQNDILSFSDRLLSFFSYILSPIIPSKLLPDYSNLASYKQDLYRSGGGGLIGVYFYTWLGFLGPVVSGIFIGYYINFFYFKNSIYYKLYGLCLMISFPRWYAYSPIFLIKFCLYSVILFFIISIFSKHFSNDTCSSS